MDIFPSKSETIVLPYSAAEVTLKLDGATKPIGEEHEIPIEEDDFIFNGKILENSFVISRKVDYPQNFLPLVTGKVDDTNNGCILFVKYKLFYSTLFYLIFWTVVCVLLGIFFIVAHREFLYAAIAFGFCITNYFIAMANFRKQVNLTKNALMRLLN